MGVLWFGLGGVAVVLRLMFAFVWTGGLGLLVGVVFGCLLLVFCVAQVLCLLVMLFGGLRWCALMVTVCDSDNVCFGLAFDFWVDDLGLGCCLDCCLDVVSYVNSVGVLVL